MLQRSAIRVPGLVHLVYFISRAAFLLFFITSPAATLASELQLATDLFAGGQWADCHRECLRQLAETPGDETAMLLSTASQLGLTNESPQVLAALRSLSTSAESRNVRAMAAFELGRAEWIRRDGAAAFVFLSQAYSEAGDLELSLRVGCSLDLLRKDFPNLGKKNYAFFQTLEASRALWTPEVIKECSVNPKSDRGFLSKPGEWVVAFYRAQMRSALGPRCPLLPSCSEYFLLASEKHGLLALPMIADRFTREPSVMKSAERPIPVGEHIRFYDPLSDHDGWMTGGSK